MLKHTTGCLLALAERGEFDIIVHGCNCFCCMGAGIAARIAKLYPQAYRADCKTKPGDASKLGTYTAASAGNFVIVNAYTQYSTAKTFGQDVFEYTAFKTVLNTLAQESPAARFGLPYIGMGLAGGNADRILPIIEEFADSVSKTGGSVTLVKFNP